MTPHEELTDLGYRIVEYHPRSHGRSRGQMSMPAAIQDLYELLITRGLHDAPLVIFAHSAGCNAALQLNRSFLNILHYFLVQPVFDFRESMFHMYQRGTHNEVCDALARWVTDKHELDNLLRSPLWLSVEDWYRDDFRSKFNSISNDLQVGDFLQDFYIPGYSTANSISAIRDRTTILLGQQDNWYPVATTRKTCSSNDVPFSEIDDAKDHFMTGGWPNVWSHVLPKLATLPVSEVGS